MPETRIPVQAIDFEGHRARVNAVYDADGDGRYRFVKFELTERKRVGRPPGSKAARKRRKRAQAKAAE
jgi:hypothetical protein